MEDASGEDELVEPDQGNGKSWVKMSASQILTERSPLAHHLAVATGRRPESRRPAHIHPRAPVHAGTDHQVR